MVTLKNWRIVKEGHGNHILAGEVYGHPFQPDGKVVNTSQIISWNEASGAVVCASREYVLGDPHPNYEKAFPNVRARFIAQLIREKKGK